MSDSDDDDFSRYTRALKALYPPTPSSALERRMTYAVSHGQASQSSSSSWKKKKKLDLQRRRREKEDAAAAESQHGGLGGPHLEPVSPRTALALDRMVAGKAARPLNAEYSEEARRVLRNVPWRQPVRQSTSARAKEYDHVRRSNAPPPLSPPPPQPRNSQVSMSLRLSLGQCARIYKSADFRKPKKESVKQQELDFDFDYTSTPEASQAYANQAAARPLYTDSLIEALSSAARPQPSNPLPFVDVVDWHIRVQHEAFVANAALAEQLRELSAARLLALSESLSLQRRQPLEGVGGGAAALVRAHARIAATYYAHYDHAEAALTHCQLATDAADAARAALPRFAPACTSMACWGACACQLAGSVCLNSADPDAALTWLSRAERGFEAAGEALESEDVLHMARFGLLADVAALHADKLDAASANLQALLSVVESQDDAAPDVARAVDAAWLEKWNGETLDVALVLPFDPASLFVTRAAALRLAGDTHTAAGHLLDAARTYAKSLRACDDATAIDEATKRLRALDDYAPKYYLSRSLKTFEDASEARKHASELSKSVKGVIEEALAVVGGETTLAEEEEEEEEER